MSLSSSKPARIPEIAASVTPPELGGGMVTIIDAAGQRYMAPQLTLHWRRAPLPRPLTLRRRVIGPFASFEIIPPLRGGSAASAGLRASRPQRTASLNARWRIVWT